MKRRSAPVRGRQPTPPQQGLTLAVGLVLLAVMTLVVVAGATTATLQLRMAAGRQAAIGTFQVAENALATALACFDPSAATLTVDPCPATATAANEEVAVLIERDAAEAGTPLPLGVSLGAELEAVAYNATAEVTGRRGASTTVTQGFYVVARRD